MQSSIIDLEEVFYPESDGKPMAENTLQFEWITLVKQGLDAVFFHRDDVFIAGDLLWYPVQGDNKLTQAPDVMVALGRPKGHRRSYLQWKEEDIPPQVVFEILSPGNRSGEMARKYAFYEKYGVLEYYVYDPDHFILTAAIRSEATDSFVDLSEPELWHWTSPLLGISFHWKRGVELELKDPYGERFLTYIEMLEFKNNNDALQVQLDVEKQRVDLLAQKLRELGIDPDELTKP